MKVTLACWAFQRITFLCKKNLCNNKCIVLISCTNESTALLGCPICLSSGLWLGRDWKQVLCVFSFACTFSLVEHFLVSRLVFGVNRVNHWPRGFILEDPPRWATQCVIRRQVKGYQGIWLQSFALGSPALLGFFKSQFAMASHLANWFDQSQDCPVKLGIAHGSAQNSPQSLKPCFILEDATCECSPR